MVATLLSAYRLGRDVLSGNRTVATLLSSWCACYRTCWRSAGESRCDSPAVAFDDPDAHVTNSLAVAFVGIEVAKTSVRRPLKNVNDDLRPVLVVETGCVWPEVEHGAAGGVFRRTDEHAGVMRW
jgi:hypothetical protein